MTQGTLVLDDRMLLVPTIQALADREECIVTGVLGKKDVTLAGVEFPNDAKVIY